MGSNPTPAALQAGFRVAERFTAPDGARIGASAQPLETALDRWNVATTGALLAQILTLPRSGLLRPFPQQDLQAVKPLVDVAYVVRGRRCGTAGPPRPLLGGPRHERARDRRRNHGKKGEPEQHHERGDEPPRRPSPRSVESACLRGSRVTSLSRVLEAGRPTVRHGTDCLMKQMTLAGQTLIPESAIRSQG